MVTLYFYALQTMDSKSLSWTGGRRFEPRARPEAVSEPVTAAEQSGRAARRGRRQAAALRCCNSRTILQKLLQKGLPDMMSISERERGVKEKQVS